MNKELELAIIASLEGGEAIMDIYKNDFNIEYKEDNSPLTLADQNCNDVINSYLIKTPIPIISEENKQLSYADRKDWETCWIVDPLDGTKEFVKRNGEFTVNIALVKKGKPVLGVIYVPDQKILYYADVDLKKAYKVQLDSHKEDLNQIKNKAIEIKPSPVNRNRIRLVGSRSHMNKETTDFIESLRKDYKEVEIVSKGSSLKFCMIAEGDADIYPRFAPTMEWDTAAGQAICEAVGLKVISQETNEPLLYNKENLLNPWFLVS
ncbi:MAG: 3'(2'),5'-bisphosphate nucleotidase [Flavobacteriia bacterium]|nr:MAG: 3'(2'),5'-bisphosphate nucleotidase [Flavobacteriia bacterium]